MLKINYSANHSTNSPSHFGLKDRKAASQRDGTAMKLLHFSPGFIPGKVEAKLGREHVKPGHVFKSAHLESPMLPAFDPYAPLPSEAAVDETLEKLQVLREEVGDIAKEEYQQCYVNIFNRNPPAGLELSKLKSFPSMKSTVNMATYFTYQDKVHETENKLCCQVLYNCYFMIPKSSEMAGLIKKKFALHIRNLPSSKCKDFIEKICSHAKNEMNKEFPMLFVQPNMTQYLDAFSPLLKLEDLLSKKEKEKLQAKSDLTHLCLLHQQILLPMIDKALIYSNLDLKNNTPISPSHIISFLTLAEVGGNNNESSTGSLLNEDEKMPALQDLEMPALNEPSRSDYDYKKC
ncbi:predicted protein [Chaetoceros tenuissimus]|uniref:Uncharacterized protein n=1 Tax=Chaetoceros tenuissimus TaxID=426638 RepID=A0AAD3CU65_9STRA|nr:predicted protein [Chaetoceros tenuissimus]